MKKKLTNFLLVIFSFGLGLLIAELLIRLFWPQNLVYHNESVWKPDEVLGWRHYELVNEQVNFGQAEVTFRTDAQGFRINAKDKPTYEDSSINVLVLGDSFIEAVQVESQNTVPQVLERQLNRLPELDTRFYNAGVSGWNPNQYYLEARRILNEGKPEIDHVLVFLYEANDLVHREKELFVKRDKHNTRPFRIPKNLNKGELTNSILYPLNNFLEKKSQLFILLRTRSNKLMSKLGLSSAYFPLIFYKRYQNIEAWEVTTGVCKKIEQAFGQYDIPVDFVLIPTTYHVNLKVLEEYLDVFSIHADSLDMQQPNRILGELFARESMSFHDPLVNFRQKTENGTVLYGTIDTHFNEAGHQAMADYLMPVLSEKLMKKEKEMPDGQ